MSTLHHIGCSGGKDSTALVLWAIHESGLPRESLRVTFCDTGNEDRLTYEHLDLIRRTVVEPAGIVGGLETLKPERNFFELALHKRRFPSRKAQFCTQHLKLFPTQKWLRARQNEGHDVVMLNGKRTGESEQRKAAMAGKPERAWSDFWGCDEWAPLMKWTIQDVVAIHKRHGVPLNPLYALGAKRVGCFPCMNCGKSEIRLVAKHRPEKIAQIRDAEKRVSSERSHHGRASFFPAQTVTAPFRSVKYVSGKDGMEYEGVTIDDVVAWANTTRGGRQYRLELDDEPKACWMNYGACE